MSQRRRAHNRSRLFSVRPFLIPVLLILILSAAPRVALAASASLTDLGPVQKDSSREWLVMVYLDGDNNLEQAALRDLDEMEAGLPQKGVDILVLMDRAREYSQDEGDWTEARVYRVRRDDQPGLRSEVLSVPGELNMGDPAVLQAFMTTAMKTFPAKRRALVLWNHGGGWVIHVTDDEAPGADQGFDGLTLPELHQAVGSSLSAAGLKKLDMIAFDMCLMAQIETAYEVENLAQVMVASEASAPNNGWPYDQVIPLFGRRGASNKDIAKGIVTAFHEFYVREQQPMATHSAFDLSQTGAVVQSLSKYLAVVDRSLPQVWPSLVRSMFYSVSYSDLDDLRRGPGAVLSVDLGDAFRNLAGVAPGLASSREYKNFEQALARFVLDSKNSDRYGRSQGVAIYAPFRQDLFNKEYTATRFARESGWLGTLGKLHQIQARDQGKPSIKSVETVSVYRKQKVEDVIQLGQDGFSFTFEGKNALWCSVYLGQRDQQGRTLIFEKAFLGGKEDMGELTVKEKSREELLTDLTYPDGLNTVSFRYDATRTLVSNGETSFPATVDISDVGDLQAHLRVVPVIYEHPQAGRLTGRVYFDWMGQSAALVVQVPQADGSSVPAQIDPDPAATVHLLYETFSDQGEPGQVVAGSMKWGQGLYLLMDLVPPGQYEVILVIESLSSEATAARHPFVVRARDDGLADAIRQAPASDYELDNFIGEWEIIDAAAWFGQGQVVSMGAIKRYERHPKYKNLLKMTLEKPKGHNILPGLDIVEIIERKGGLPHTSQYVLDEEGNPRHDYGVRRGLPVFDQSQGMYLLLSMDLFVGDLGIAVKRSGPTPHLATPAAAAPASQPQPGYQQPQQPGYQQAPAGSPVVGAWMTQGGQAVVFSENQWVYYENGGVLVDQGYYQIQGGQLVTQSDNSGQVVPYQYQINGNQLLLQNSSGELYEFYRAR